MNADHVFYPPNHLLLVLVAVPALTQDVLEADARPVTSLLASAILIVTRHSSPQMLPQPFQQKLPTRSSRVPCTSAELFVPLQCSETQTQVNLRAPSLPGKLLIKQRWVKLSLLHLCSCVEVSGLGDKSTKVFVQLFVRVPKRDYFPFPCFHLQWKDKINFEGTCILVQGKSEEKNNVSA